MATTIKKSNLNRPAPRWFRITKKIVYGIFATALFSSFLQRFGISDGDVNLISGFLIATIETLNSILANGEDYVSTRKKKSSSNKDEELPEDIGGGGIKNQIKP